MIKLAQNISTHLQAFKVLVGVNIKTTILSTRMGWLWWLLDPLIMMAIYYFLVKGIFGRGGENFHIFVLSGIVIWQFFTRSLNSSIKVIASNKQLIRQIVFPLPVLVAIPSVTHSFFAVIGVVIIMIFNYQVISIYTLAIIPLLLMVAMLSYGLGLFVSVLSVFIGDTAKFISYILRAGFFFSPILYPASRLLDSPRIPDHLKLLLQINPMMWIIPAVRKVLVAGNVYDWQQYAIRFIIMLLIIQLGLLWLRSNTAKIVKML